MFSVGKKEYIISTAKVNRDRLCGRLYGQKILLARQGTVRINHTDVIYKNCLKCIKLKYYEL
jgi:hypothetical protein